MRSIIFEIQRFEHYIKQGIPGHEHRKLANHALLLTPDGASQKKPAMAKDILLTVMGLTHGNEWAGVAVINDTLEFLQRSGLPLPGPIAFVLGNPEAARQNLRFIESDLNRSFNHANVATAEQRRALELAPILSRTHWLVDLHQTIEMSPTPFWIFPYTAAGLELAEVVAPDVPIVTHWGRGFSKDGMCTDEYVNHCGGTGVSIELGQNGFATHHVATGFKVLVNLLGHLRHETPFAGGSIMQPQFYTWAEIMPFPDGEVVLREGLYNFKAVRQGDVLGEANGHALMAGTDGYLLFPKYIRISQQTKPAELYRIIKPVQREEIGRAREVGS